MANDYGVQKVDSGEWVKTEMPLELGTATDAIDNLSFDAAITIATYLTNTEQTSFAPGRPPRRPNNA